MPKYVGFEGWVGFTDLDDGSVRPWHAHIATLKMSTASERRTSRSRAHEFENLIEFPAASDDFIVRLTELIGEPYRPLPITKRPVANSGDAAIADEISRQSWLP